MKFKVPLCYIFCMVLVLCTACNNQKSSDDIISLNEEIVYDEVIVNAGNSMHDDSNVNSNGIVSNEITNTVSDKQNTTLNENSIDYTGFNYMEYRCERDIPGHDAVYVVDFLRANDGYNVSYGFELSCEIKDVRIEGKKIYVPSNIRNSQEQILINVYHEKSGISEVFDITFDGDWNLTLEEQFDGTKLNDSLWEQSPEWYRHSGDRYSNYWSKDLTFLDGTGNLVSRIYGSNVKDDDGKNIYYSGAIWSKGLFESTYGYYEARVKLHNHTGVWGAFWILAGDMSDPNVKDDNLSLNGVELDVFESCKSANYVAHGIAWDGFGEYKNSGGNKIWQTEKVTEDLFDGNYHTFGVHWTKDEYIFYVDGIESYRFEAIGGACNVPGYLRITTECGPVNGELSLGVGEYSDMLVDYVRVYQIS